MSVTPVQGSHAGVEVTSSGSMLLALVTGGLDEGMWQPVPLGTLINWPI